MSSWEIALFETLSFQKERIMELGDLKKQCETEMGWVLPQDYLDEWVKTVLGIHKQDSNLLKVAVIEDKIVGYCISVKKLHNHEGVVMDIAWNSTYIWDLFVAKEHRKKGIGTALLNDAIAYSKAIGCDKTGLLVNYWNETAKKLFEKAGFKLWSHYLVKRL
jgi:ribosomal protein S18 acetylase RimI-like enzyme